MTKDQLMRIVEGLPEDADFEAIEDVNDLIDEAIEIKMLLLMRAAFRLRDFEARRREKAIELTIEHKEEKR